MSCHVGCDDHVDHLLSKAGTRPSVQVGEDVEIRVSQCFERDGQTEVLQTGLVVVPSVQLVLRGFCLREEELAGGQIKERQMSRLCGCVLEGSGGLLERK